MKTIESLAVVALIAIVLSSCTDLANDKYGDFRIKVDSTNHPGIVLVGDSLKIKLFGTVGPDGCSQFSHFESTEKPLDLELTIWGKREEQTACPAVMVYLNGLEYKTFAGKVGVYKISIHQPDGSILRDSVIVEPWGI